MPERNSIIAELREEYAKRWPNLTPAYRAHYFHEETRESQWGDKSQDEYVQAYRILTRWYDIFVK